MSQETSCSASPLFLLPQCAFSFDRIDAIESGRSLAFGFEYEIRDSEKDNSLFGLYLANSISDKKRENLPSKSKLDQTRSDIVGKINYTPNNFLNINYQFSYDRDLDGSNYDYISTKLDFGKLETTFGYHSQNELIGDSEIISKEKYHLIEVFGGDSNVELLKILDDDEKFRVLRNLLFELNKYGDTKKLIEEHDSLKKVFDNNFKLNIVVSITKLLAEYGIDTAGFEDIRSNLNYTLDPPYSIKKPRPKEQEFDPDAHQATTEDYVGLIKNYITLTIENTETGNISVKAIVECD